MYVVQKKRMIAAEQPQFGSGKGQVGNRIISNILLPNTTRYGEREK